MELAKIIEFNRKFKELHNMLKQEHEQCQNHTLYLAVSYMDDAGNKLNQSVGEATMAGHLTNPE